jgi:hypothetical protein
MSDDKENVIQTKKILPTDLWHHIYDFLLPENPWDRSNWSAFPASLPATFKDLHSFSQVCHLFRQITATQIQRFYQILVPHCGQPPTVIKLKWIQQVQRLVKNHPWQSISETFLDLFSKIHYQAVIGTVKLFTTVRNSHEINTLKLPVSSNICQHVFGTDEIPIHIIMRLWYKSERHKDVIMDVGKKFSVKFVNMRFRSSNFLQWYNIQTKGWMIADQSTSRLYIIHGCNSITFTLSYTVPNKVATSGVVNPDDPLFSLPLHVFVKGRIFL